MSSKRDNIRKKFTTLEQAYKELGACIKELNNRFKEEETGEYTRMLTDKRSLSNFILKIDDISEEIDDLIVESDKWIKESLNDSEIYKENSIGGVRKLGIKESLPKPNVDWNKLNGGSDENKRKFSKVYRLIKDYNLGDVSSIYTYNIEDTYLADKIENDGLWVNEDNEVVIPAGTEFTFWFDSDKTDGRDLYIYFLNVPELERDPKQYWIDRYYISDDDEGAFEILDYAKTIKNESMLRRRNRR